MSKLFVVTGYSSKKDGLLVVVEAQSEKEAIEKIVNDHEMLVDRGDDGLFLVTKERGEKYVDQCIQNCTTGWCHQLFVDQVELGKESTKAVCW